MITLLLIIGDALPIAISYKFCFGLYNKRAMKIRYFAGINKRLI